MRNNVTKADWKPAGLLPGFTQPEALPLAFTYEGKRYRGIPAEFSPVAQRRRVDANITQVLVCGRNEKGLEIRVEYTQYSDYPVQEFIAFFENRGQEDTGILSDVRIMEGTLPCEDMTLIYSNGDTIEEDGYEFFRDTLEQKLTLQPEDGTPCNGAFPYMRLQGAHYGFNIAVGWPAMWKMELMKVADGVYLSVGQKRCAMKLHPGETMRTPRITLMAYAGDETRGTNLWRSWYIAHILPRENGSPLQPKCCMHFVCVDGTPECTGVTETNQIAAIDDYLRGGIRPDIWWVDAGWYADCDFQWSKIGTWRPNPDHFPNGIGPLGEKCEKEDIRLLLWFEPERVRKGTALAKEHPEWLLDNLLPEEDLPPMRAGKMADFGNRECCDWFIRHVDGLIKQSHVQVYRQDMNFDPALHWLHNEAQDRIGAMENLHVQGYLRYWDALLERNPGLWIDACASGGRRNDLETMRRSVPLHYTDVGYGHHPIKQKQHHLMFSWIPYFRAHNMSWDDPVTGEYNSSRGVDAFAYYGAMAPALTDMTSHDAPAESFALARKMQPIWRRAADFMLSGDYYPLTPCRKSREDFYAVQFHDGNRDAGFAEVLRNNACPEESFFLQLKGLEEAGTYLLTEAESGVQMQYTAQELKTGIWVALPVRSGRIYFYERLVK